MKVVFFANTDWYLYNFRLALARALKNRGVEVVMLSPPGEFGERLEDEGFCWHRLPMNRRSLAPWAEVRVLAAVTHVLRQENPDLLHNFTMKPVVYGSICARIAGVRHVINAVTGLGHVFIDDSSRSRFLRALVGVLLRFTVDHPRSRLILQNRDDESLFVKNGLIQSERIRVIRGSGVNTERFQPTSGTRRLPVSVLLATRLLWEKGLQELVDAARVLRSEGLQVRFLVAGESDPGNPAAVPLSTIEEWVDENTIEFLGHVDDMAALLGSVDIVVLPSYREGTPRILLEAGAAGLPLITTDVPGCREVVDDGRNGILVPVRDSESLAAAVRSLVSDADARQAMGKASRQKILEEFDERIVIDRTIDVYEELAGLPA